MPLTSDRLALDDRKLAQAIVQALQMWSHPRYQDFLIGVPPEHLDPVWFDWFGGQWSVFRNVKKEEIPAVREYLDEKFRQALQQGCGADAVDAAAAEIKELQWTTINGKGAENSLPISLVSKIGFFFCPDRLVPKDTFAVKGLNKLRGLSCKPALNGPSYREFFAAFNEQYSQKEPELRAAMSEQWVKDLAGKLKCPASALTTTAMQRKLFDNYLMQVGGFER